MPYAAALSEHPVAAEAIGEVLGALVEHGSEPDLAVVFVSASHAEFMSEISAAIRAVLAPVTLVGAASGSVVGGAREVEDVPAVSVWAAWGTPVEGLRLEATDVDGGTALLGLPADLPMDSTLVLLADPSSFPAGALVDELATMRPDVSVVGGLTATGPNESGCTLVRDDVVHRSGAVGFVVAREHLVGPVVSQGCRPIGDPMTVTAADRQYLLELAGQPAMARLSEVVESLGPDDRALVAGGVQLGIVIDEAKEDFDRGDFLVRQVLGGDRARGVLAVGAEIPVGATVQFHVRDARSAHEDLESLLAGVHGDGALLFTCSGRGRHLFGHDDHDAATVVDLVGTQAVAGMSCVGELGPVAGRTRLHGYTASVLVFADTG